MSLVASSIVGSTTGLSIFRCPTIPTPRNQAQARIVAIERVISLSICEKGVHGIQIQPTDDAKREARPLGRLIAEQLPVWSRRTSILPNAVEHNGGDGHSYSCSDLSPTAPVKTSMGMGEKKKKSYLSHGLEQRPCEALLVGKGHLGGE